MLTIGDILALSKRSDLALRDLNLSAKLLAEVEASAQGEGLSPERLARRAVARFTHEASPADWSSLMARLRDVSDPGSACLEFIMRRWLNESAPLSPSPP
jgi:hypothetical protein